MLLNIDTNAFLALAFLPVLGVTAFLLCAWLAVKLIGRT